MTVRLTTLFGLMLLAVLSRLLPHPPNATAIAALALFGGAHFVERRWAFAMPIAAMLISDLVIGFHEHVWFVYGSFLVITCIGCWLRRHRTALPIAGATVLSSAIFFLITNFGVWMSGTMYPRTFEGLSACYVAALPFFNYTLAGDVLYTFGLFGCAWAADRWMSRVAEVGPRRSPASQHGEIVFDRDIERRRRHFQRHVLVQAKISYLQ
jgi:hypothetical protein